MTRKGGLEGGLMECEATRTFSGVIDLYVEFVIIQTHGVLCPKITGIILIL